MTISERAAGRSVEAARTRADGEVRDLVDAGLAVLRREGLDGLTVADILVEAGLSTRAFYRHFRSKDELILAIYETDARATRDRMQRRLERTSGPQEALEVWIDETLALVFNDQRARRTRPLASAGPRLQAQYPHEFAAIVAGVIDPLVAVLRAGLERGHFPQADPERDAHSIHAITWALASARMHDHAISVETARQQILRFCLPAIGASR